MGHSNNHRTIPTNTKQKLVFYAKLRVETAAIEDFDNWNSVNVNSNNSWNLGLAEVNECCAYRNKDSLSVRPVVGVVKNDFARRFESCSVPGTAATFIESRIGPFNVGAVRRLGVWPFEKNLGLAVVICHLVFKLGVYGDCVSCVWVEIWNSYCVNLLSIKNVSLSGFVENPCWCVKRIIPQIAEVYAFVIGVPTLSSRLNVEKRIHQVSL